MKKILLRIVVVVLFSYSHQSLSSSLFSEDSSEVETGTGVIFAELNESGSDLYKFYHISAILKINDNRFSNLYTFKNIQFPELGFGCGRGYNSCTYNPISGNSFKFDDFSWDIEAIFSSQTQKIKLEKNEDYFKYGVIRHIEYDTDSYRRAKVLKQQKEQEQEQQRKKKDEEEKSIGSKLKSFFN